MHHISYSYTLILYTLILSYYTTTDKKGTKNTYTEEWQKNKNIIILKYDYTIPGLLGENITSPGLPLLKLFTHMSWTFLK